MIVHVVHVLFPTVIFICKPLHIHWFIPPAFGPLSRGNERAPVSEEALPLSPLRYPNGQTNHKLLR